MHNEALTGETRWNKYHTYSCIVHIFGIWWLTSALLDCYCCMFLEMFLWVFLYCFSANCLLHKISTAIIHVRPTRDEHQCRRGPLGTAGFGSIPLEVHIPVSLTQIVWCAFFGYWLTKVRQVHICQAFSAQIPSGSGQDGAPEHPPRQGDAGPWTGG